MKEVLLAMVAAMRSLFHPGMLALVLWPMLGAVLFWLGAAYFFWGDWARDLGSWIASTPAEQWMETGFLAAISGYLVTFLLVMLLLPAIYVTALLLAAVFAMPSMVNHVASRNYPDLEKKRGGTMAGSLLNSLVAVSVFCLLWLLTLPLWLLSPLAFLLPVALSAYLNQRLFRYDALAEHAGREEFAALLEKSAGKLYLLGALSGLLHYIPVINLLSPIYIGLAFTHLCLGELDRLRKGI
ncbi:MAG: EI24 domain-containing protein [Burkholderiales bacterium]|nr:EI24 domain-containing protein [Burkholderiales bacterium]